MSDPGARILVAGIGNIFLGDDAFGVEVSRRLAHVPLGSQVRLLDVGTRSLHLAYELLDGSYDTAILVDAVARGGEPGTIYVLEPDDGSDISVPVDGHGVRPEHALAMLRQLGGTVGRTLIVGCEPERIDAGQALSLPVAAVVDEAVRIVVQLVHEAQGAASTNR
ncbi:MAG TPA: hydrogenase maturation protease [Gemmatimonadaceae bacterium]|nr:hydrogenase maturation protease [Gemmatimonadaceae bacterium]